MKKNILPIFATFLLISACSSTNKIFETQDEFKHQTTIKLNQRLKAYSDERRKLHGTWADYYITFKHFYAKESTAPGKYSLDVKMSTSVRAYEIEPVLYISTDGYQMRLEAEEAITKMYQQGSSSSSSESTVTVSEDSSDDGTDTGESKVETTTTYTTSSSHNTYQLMNLSFAPDLELLKKIAGSKKTVFRLYIKNEAIDAPLRRKEKRKFIKYVDRLSMGN